MGGCSSVLLVSGCRYGTSGVSFIRGEVLGGSILGNPNVGVLRSLMVSWMLFCFAVPSAWRMAGDNVFDGLSCNRGGTVQYMLHMDGRRSLAWPEWEWRAAHVPRRGGCFHYGFELVYPRGRADCCMHGSGGCEICAWHGELAGSRLAPNIFDVELCMSCGF